MCLVDGVTIDGRDARLRIGKIRTQFGADVISLEICDGSGDREVLLPGLDTPAAVVAVIVTGTARAFDLFALDGRDVRLSIGRFDGERGLFVRIDDGSIVLLPDASGAPAEITAVIRQLMSEKYDHDRRRPYSLVGRVRDSYPGAVS